MIDADKIKSISLVVPLFNETKNIGKSLPVIEEELNDIEKEFLINCELVLVDDGSSDTTLEIVRSIAKFHNTQIISLPNNSGKGFALKKGFEVATGNFIFFMDADLSTPISYIKEFLQLADSAIVIGTRKTHPELVKVAQPWLRRKLGRGFTVLANLILGTSVSDFTCGFKMFPATMGKKIFHNLTIARWGFDAEVVFLAKRFGYSILEIPVVWTNDADTKVRLSRDILGSLRDIIKTRMNSFSGVYEHR